MVTLIVRQKIRAKAERLFTAWTTPEQLKLWWGPEGVKCTEAEVELRKGGRYRIANQFADGKMVWISGTFEEIERPRKLVYSWGIEPESGEAERVTVQFQESGEYTEVTVTHERIASEAVREMHEQGWLGCLGGLARYAERE